MFFSVFDSYMSVECVRKFVIAFQPNGVYLKYCTLNRADSTTLQKKKSWFSGCKCFFPLFLYLHIVVSFLFCSFLSPSHFILAKSIAKQFRMKYKCWYYYLLMAQFSHICFSIHVLLVSPRSFGLLDAHTRAQQSTIYNWLAISKSNGRGNNDIKMKQIIFWFVVIKLHKRACNNQMKWKIKQVNALTSQRVKSKAFYDYYDDWCVWQKTSTHHTFVVSIAYKFQRCLNIKMKNKDTQWIFAYIFGSQ